MIQLSWPVWALIILMVVYFIVAIAFGFHMSSFRMGLLWPLWVMFGLFGNIQ